MPDLISQLTGAFEGQYRIERLLGEGGMAIVYLAPYESDASGVNEIYVQAYADGGQRQIVASGGGSDPVWASDGSELSFRRGNSIMAVPVRTGQQFQILGPAVELFSGPYDFTQTGNWTVGPSGRFLMIKADPTTTTRFQVVLNWFQELSSRGTAAGNR